MMPRQQRLPGIVFSGDSCSGLYGHGLRSVACCRLHQEGGHYLRPTFRFISALPDEPGMPVSFSGLPPEKWRQTFGIRALRPAGQRRVYRVCIAFVLRAGMVWVSHAPVGVAHKEETP